MKRDPILLVQTARFDQLIWVAQRLRKRHPQRPLHLLARPGRAAEFYVKQFPLFETVTWWPKRPPEAADVIAPLMATGYWGLKRFARCRGASDIDYAGRRRRLTWLRAVGSLIAPLHRPDPEWAEFAGRLPFPDPGGRVLLCRPGCPEALPDQVRERFAGSPTVRAINRGPVWRQWRRLRRQRFDTAVMFLAADRETSNLLLLPWLLGIPRVLVAAGGNRFVELDRPRLARLLLARYRSGFEQRKPAARVTLFQTEHFRYVEAAARRLRAPDLYPECRIHLCCRPDDRERLASLPGVEAVSVYPDGRDLPGLAALLRRLRSFSADFSVALFTGRPVFRFAKLLFLLGGGRQMRVFNADLDLYRLAPSTLSRVWRRDRVRPELAGPPSGSLLFLQTATAGLTLEAVDRARRPDVAGVARIVLLCPEAETSRFADAGSVDEVLPYSPRWRDLPALIRRVRASGADVVGAVETREPIFRKQKWLFWLLPVRHRLLFNGQLDCRFVTRLGYWRDTRDGVDPLPLRLYRSLMKVLLYLPRCAYLVIWLTVTLYRSGYTRTREE